MVPAGTFSIVVLGSILLNSQNIIRRRDERKQGNDDGGDPNGLEQPTAAARMAHHTARNAYRV